MDLLRKWPTDEAQEERGTGLLPTSMGAAVASIQKGFAFLGVISNLFEDN